MKLLIKKACLLALLHTPGVFGNNQDANAQFPTPEVNSVNYIFENADKLSAKELNDSLRYFLEYFYANTTNQHLKQALQDVQNLHNTGAINDSLAKKLLTLEDSLLGNSIVNKEKVFSYAEILSCLFFYLSPGGENLYYAASINNLAGLHVARFSYKARPAYLYLLALKIRKKILGEEHPDYAKSLNDLAVLYQYTNEPDEALSLNEQALKIRKKILGEEHPDYLVSLNNLAYSYFFLKQYSKALFLKEQQLALQKKISGEENPGYANCLNDLAVSYSLTGQHDHALSLYQQALTIMKKTLGGENSNYADILNNLAKLYDRTGQYEKALVLNEQVLAIRKNLFGEEYVEYSASLNNVAVLQWRTGHYEKALSLFMQALAINKKISGEEHPDYFICLNNLAILYEDLGQYDKALSLFEQALAIKEKLLGEDNADYASYLRNMATLFVYTKQYKKAIPLCRKALKIEKKILGEDNPSYAFTLNSLADLYRFTGQYDSALYLCKQALQIRKKIIGEAHLDYIINLNSLANLYSRMGDTGNAIALYKQALQIGKIILGEEHPDYIEILKNLGLCYTGSNRSEAADLLIEANNIKVKHLIRTNTTLSEHEKITFINKESPQFWYLPSLLFTNTTLPPNAFQQIYLNELTLKGMVLEDQQKVFSVIRKSGDSAVLNLYEQWRFNKAFLGNQFLLSATKRVPYLDSLEEATNQLEQLLSRTSAAFLDQQQNQRITTTTIANKLTKGEAAIEFIKFKLYNKKFADSTIYAALLLLPGDSIPKFIRLFEERKLRRLLQASDLNQLYPAKNNSSKYSISKRNSLFNLVWRPLEKYLTGINTINYAPTGLLHTISFQALLYNPSQLLIDKYQLNQLLSTRSLVMPAQTTTPQSVNLWGDIQYDFRSNNVNSQIYAAEQKSKTPSNLNTGSTASTFNFYAEDTRGSRGGTFGKLPGTKLEIENINTLFSTAGIRVTILSDTTATEEAFKALDGKSPGVLHLATHGFFLPVKEGRSKSHATDNQFTTQENPMFRSGLVLAGGNHAWKGESTIPGNEDGILTAYEIAQMDLSNTDLVVLSACKTALGDLGGNEGVIGLQRAFKMAGVKELIISLWPVPDPQTVELMTMFYRNFINGQSPREALRSAQLKMKEKYAPYYWAAFVLVE